MKFGNLYVEATDKDRKRLLGEVVMGLPWQPPNRRVRDSLAEEVSLEEDLILFCMAYMDSSSGTLFLCSKRILYLDSAKGDKKVEIELDTIKGLGIQGNSIMIVSDTDQFQLKLGPKSVCSHLLQTIEKSLTSTPQDLSDQKFLDYLSKKNSDSLKNAQLLMKSKIEEEEKQDKNYKSIENRLNVLGKGNQFGTKRELIHLAKVLNEGEIILDLVVGIIDKSLCIVTCTDLRVIWIDRRLLFKAGVREARLESIGSISYDQGLVFGSVSISVGLKEINISNIQKKEVLQFVETVNSARDKFTENSRSSHASDADAGGIVVQLTKLDKLRETGAVTEEEYDEIKKALIQKL